MIKYYNVGEDELKPVTQDWVDDVQNTIQRQGFRNHILRKILNLNLSNDDDYSKLKEIEKVI